MQQKIRFQIEGMTCQACASRIEKVLNKKDFVESAGVNFASEEAQVTFDDSKTSVADIAKIIEKIGYGAKEKTEDALPQPEETAHIGWRLWLLREGKNGRRAAATRRNRAYRLAAVAAVRHQRPVPYRHGGDDDWQTRLDGSAGMAVCIGECGAALAGGAILQKRVGEH